MQDRSGWSCLPFRQSIFILFSIQEQKGEQEEASHFMTEGNWIFRIESSPLTPVRLLWPFSQQRHKSPALRDRLQMPHPASWPSSSWPRLCIPYWSTKQEAAQLGWPSYQKAKLSPNEDCSQDLDYVPPRSPPPHWCCFYFKKSLNLAIHEISQMWRHVHLGL